VNKGMKKHILFLFFVVMLSSCAKNDCQQHTPEADLEPIVVYQSFGTNYLLTCLNESKNIGRGEFDINFEMAEKDLQSGKDIDKLRFICLSFNEKADHMQFKEGMIALERYIDDHPDSGEEIHGFQVLADRLNQEIMNRWSAWKTLLNDKKKLVSEVESLRLNLETAQIKNDELQQQIEQLKNIDNIIKSRETDQR
jgi:hypothetical protein